MLARMRKLRQLSTSLGRQQFWRGARNHLWPQLRVLAGLHRRTLARRVRVVAIVGSFGKTTTTAAICKVLGLAVPPPDRGPRGALHDRLLQPPPDPLRHLPETGDRLVASLGWARRLRPAAAR
jgi:hypothetical protein